MQKIILYLACKFNKYCLRHIFLDFARIIIYSHLGKSAGHKEHNAIQFLALPSDHEIILFQKTHSKRTAKQIDVFLNRKMQPALPALPKIQSS